MNVARSSCETKPIDAADLNDDLPPCTTMASEAQADAGDILIAGYHTLKPHAKYNVCWTGGGRCMHHHDPQVFGIPDRNLT